MTEPSALFPNVHAHATRADVRWGIIRTTAIVVSMSVLYAVLPLAGEWRWAGAVVGIAAIVGTIPYTVNRVRAILKSDQPLIHAIEALVMLLTMVVLGFAAVYYFLANGKPGNFSGLETRLDAVYFTVTTLSTVGFGDIVATSQPARGIVVSQIAVNFALLGAAVRVLTMATRHRMGRSV